MRLLHGSPRRPLASSLVLAVVVATLSASIASAAKREEMVPMRDGVKLATNITLPPGEGPFPVVLTRTPYGKDEGLSLVGERYVKDGYAYVVQDCRGRFKSEGKYQTFETDRDDGYDTLEWISKQPWCNGKVGMSGASAMGITSLLAAISQHPALKCAFVIVAPESFWTEATFIGGVFKEADTTGWLRGQKAEDQIPLRRAALSDTKLELAQDIAAHRDKIQIPIFHVGGWYDIFAVGTQGNFCYLHNHGAPGARGKQKLVMGPFGHGSLKGELKYEAGGGLLNSMGDESRWFAHYLKGEDNGIDREPPVKFYQMASARKKAFSKKNGWQTADNWPPEATETRYYLAGQNELSTTAPAISESSTSYDFDPKNPVTTVGGANLTLPIGPLDQREVGNRPDYLRFQTPVLEKDVKIGGRVTLDLFAATDGLDTDFCVKLVDVYPDGYEALILDQPLRARYRAGHRPADVKMMKPGEPTRMTVVLGSTSQLFEAGHHIAVHITSSNHPRFEVNPNTGEAPGKNDKPPRVAHNTIYHDAEHPTALVLPVEE